ncbi:MAG: hypothetical protein ACOC1P_02855 [Minisyncoccales bacterium]
MASNLGVTNQVFRELTPTQKSMVKRASFKGKDMVLLHPWSNPKTHAQTLGWKKYSIIKIKNDKGYILIKK